MTQGTKMIFTEGRNFTISLHQSLAYSWTTNGRGYVRSGRVTTKEKAFTS